MVIALLGRNRMVRNDNIFSFWTHCHNHTTASSDCFVPDSEPEIVAAPHKFDTDYTTASNCIFIIDSEAFLSVQCEALNVDHKHIGTAIKLYLSSDKKISFGARR